ncbi:hypothetical protein BKA70DRAFT_1232578 [Coprinopsis sp. MPI-PUGE-AT-0042]|nr:hypothetical protein BKA70DRAFT_1232578 [Coprinopsis sp. MPI-PUGE-AT-0042]
MGVVNKGREEQAPRYDSDQARLDHDKFDSMIELLYGIPHGENQETKTDIVRIHLQYALVHGNHRYCAAWGAQDLMVTSINDQGTIQYKVERQVAISVGDGVLNVSWRKVLSGLRQKGFGLEVSICLYILAVMLSKLSKSFRAEGGSSSGRSHSQSRGKVQEGDGQGDDPDGKGSCESSLMSYQSEKEAHVQWPVPLGGKEMGKKQMEGARKYEAQTFLGSRRQSFSAVQRNCKERAKRLACDVKRAYSDSIDPDHGSDCSCISPTSAI